jgi:hypothetical protein
MVLKLRVTHDATWLNTLSIDPACFRSTVASSSRIWEEIMGQSTDNACDRVGESYEHHVLPRDVFPIADDSFGNQICICFSGPKCGYVYFRDHEHEAEDEPTYDNMHLVAKSFTEFLDKLTSPD